MQKIYFCKDNDNTKKLFKALKEQYPDMKVKRKDCLGKCKTCKHCPFSVLDGKLLKCETIKELNKKIIDQIAN